MVVQELASARGANEMMIAVHVGDMGIDGRIYPVGAKPADIASRKTRTGHTGEHIFAEDWFPIQVKQMDKVGRLDIDAFEAVMESEERLRGRANSWGERTSQQT
jgi:hypothetical protein